MTSEGQVLLDDALPPGPARRLPSPLCPSVPWRSARAHACRGGHPIRMHGQQKAHCCKMVRTMSAPFTFIPDDCLGCRSRRRAAAAASNVDGMEEEIEKDGGWRWEGGSEGGGVPQEMGGGREKRKFAVHFMISPTVCESDTPLSLSAFSPSPRKEAE